MSGTNCEECTYLVFDEELGEDYCEMYLDEDDLAKAAEMGRQYVCPYFQYRDEYRIVRKQM